MNDAANVTIAIVKVQDVCARVQPNSRSSGSTKTLHAYSVPSARFMQTPPTTGSHRFMGSLLRVKEQDDSRDEPPGRGGSGGFAGSPELFEQARDVARHRVERWRPAQRARAGTADDLVQRKGVRILTHLGPRLHDGHMPHVGSHLR